MAERKIKVVLDTNWYISASINKNSRRTLYPLLINKKFRLFYSPDLLEEYQEVIKRPFFRKYISNEQVARFSRFVIPLLIRIDLKSDIHISRDIKDDHILALAVDSKANDLISADKDLLVLKKIGTTKILTITEFITLMSVKGIL